MSKPPAEAIMQRAGTLLELGRWEELRTAAQRALAHRPDAPLARAYLARALTEMGEHQTALLHAERAVAGHPNSAYMWHLKALVLRGLSRNEEYFEAAKEALRLDPEDAWCWIEAARSARSTGRGEEALALAQRAVGEHPLHSACWVELAAQAQAERRWVEMERAGRRGLSIDPMDKWLWGKVGRALEEQGLLDEAIEIYRKCLGIDPSWTYPLGRIALALDRVGQEEEALAMARRAAAVRPQRAGSYWHLFRLLQRQAPARAVEEAEELVRRLPGQIDGWLYLSEALQKRSLHEEALRAARRAHELAPHDAAASSRVVNVLARAGRTREAVEMAKARVEMYPTAVRSWTLLAWVAAAEDPALTKEALLNAEQLEPGSRAAWRAGVSLYLHVGDEELALRSYRRLVALNREDPSTWFMGAWLAVHLGPEKMDVEDVFAKAYAVCNFRDDQDLLTGYQQCLNEENEAAAASLMHCFDRGLQDCLAVMLYAVIAARAGRLDEARRLRDGGSIGAGEIRQCMLPSCPNGQVLERELATMGVVLPL